MDNFGVAILLKIRAIEQTCSTAPKIAFGFVLLHYSTLVLQLANKTAECTLNIVTSVILTINGDDSIAVYLLYRHFPAADDGVKRLIGDAVSLIYALGALQYHQTGAFSLTDQVELCRLFSSEIEYSDENLVAIMKGA